jgi:2'-5' RNA ligase
MRVKKYIQFVKESTGYKLGCVMIEVPVSNWNEITSIIYKDDLYEVEGEKYGIQTNPHLTLLYGLKPNITKEQIEQVLEKSVDGEKIEIEIENIGLFENENFDVVKFNIKKTEQLQKLFDYLSQLPNENTFPDYNPHMTIAYVKKGLGEKYKKKYSHKVSSNEICYSMANGEKVYFEI